MMFGIFKGGLGGYGATILYQNSVSSSEGPKSPVKDETSLANDPKYKDAFSSHH